MIVKILCLALLGFALVQARPADEAASENVASTPEAPESPPAGEAEGGPLGNLLGGLSAIPGNPLGGGKGGGPLGSILNKFPGGGLLGNSFGGGLPGGQ